MKLLISALSISWLAGCTADAGAQSSASALSAIQGFVADFARQVLAAALV